MNNEQKISAYISQHRHIILTFGKKIKNNILGKKINYINLQTDGAIISKHTQIS